MSEAVVEIKAQARLVRQRDEAISLLHMQIKKGAEIKAWRIRNPQDLDKARSAKLQWTTDCIELLNGLFDNHDIADECNDWVGKIYPEYADFGNFVEQFYAEMDHRLKKIKGVLKRVQMEKSHAPVATEHPVAAPAPPAAPAESSQPATAAVGISGIVVTDQADDPLKQAVADFLKSLNFAITVVDEAAKMATEMANATFAVVLKGQEFDLGFCAGKLGADRVLLLQNQPAGHGLPHIAPDSGGGWQLQLARHLKRVGLPVDLNRLC